MNAHVFWDVLMCVCGCGGGFKCKVVYVLLCFDLTV